MKIMRIISALCALLLCLPCLTYTKAESPASAEGYRVVGYLPDWSYSCYKTLDYSKLTHICIAFCNPDTQGNLSCYIPEAEMNALVEKAHENNVSVLASLGGAGGSGNYPALVADTAKISAFNEKIMAFCEKYNLDGLDLDIEGEVEQVFWQTYDEWCLSLRNLCDERGLLLTTASAGWIARRVSDNAFACFDFVNVMAYDNDGSTVSHAGMDFALSSLDYFANTRKIAKEKLVLGVPFYGRGYNNDGTLSWASYVPFSELVAADTDNYAKDAYNGIAYNGAETIKEKCALAKEYGGIMIWEISQDAAGEYSLLDIIGTEMLGNSEPEFSADDVYSLKKHLHGTEALSSEKAAALDMQGDGVTDSADLCLIKRRLSGK